MKLLDYLSNVQKRPGMYMADGTCLRDLELILSGYGAALHAHDIENDLTRFNKEFGEYVYKETQWSTNRGWAQAITDNSSSAEIAVEKFFSLTSGFLEKEKGKKESFS